MKLSLILSVVFAFSLSQAKVNEKSTAVQPEAEVSTLQSELENELDEIPDDLEFDADDQFSNEDSSFEDEEIERMALADEEETTAAQKNSTPKTKK